MFSNHVMRLDIQLTIVIDWIAIIITIHFYIAIRAILFGSIRSLSIIFQIEAPHTLFVTVSMVSDHCVLLFVVQMVGLVEV